MWASDGTPSGTEVIFDLSDDDDGVRESFAALGDRAYFFALGSGRSQERLWSTDGTRGGTRPEWKVTDGYSGRDLIAVGDALYFTTVGSGERLWRSDGTGDGTIALRRFRYQPYDFTDVNGRLLFLLDDPAHHPELAGNDAARPDAVWTTDGTKAGTRALNGASSMDIRDSAAVVGRIWYIATGSTIWRTDGTPAGTSTVIDLPSAGAIELLAAEPCVP